jgi:hypothetical protein
MYKTSYSTLLFNNILTLLTVILFYINILFLSTNVYAQKESKNQPKSSQSDLYMTLNIGTHSLVDTQSFNDALKLDLGLWFDYDNIALDFNLGVSKSLNGYSKSRIKYVNNFWWFRSDNFIHFFLYKSRASLSLAGGIGLRQLCEDITHSYTEGKFLKIRSYEEKQFNQTTVSLMAKLTYMYRIDAYKILKDKLNTNDSIAYKKAWLISVAYESLTFIEPTLNILSINFGLAF